MNARRMRDGATVLATLAASLLLPEYSHAPAASTSSSSRPVNAVTRAGSPLEQAAPHASEAWLADRVLVRAQPGVDLEALAADHGATVLRERGPSGLATLGVGEDQRPDELIATLRQDERVLRAGPSGRIRGASSRSVGSYQWHMPYVGATSTSIDASGVTVAVLDTGVAHASGCTTAAGLETVSVVSPLDLVGDTSAACDDHMHGTHIASLIASKGKLRGVGRGAAILPVKVLDADNEGDEQALIDGILWAVDAGADVINLSLSFAPDYAPSPELLVALRTAHDAGALLVAAAGNDGGDVVTWPAASPLVIGVGAAALDGDGALTPATYSDLGPEIDLMAPGGALDLDHTGDGKGDGLLAATFTEGSPSSLGYWFAEGTSQAAALVSGAAAALLAKGVAPEDVLPTLQASAKAIGADGWGGGVGPGSLDLGAALSRVSAGSTVEGRALHAAILPFLTREDGDASLVPSALVRVLDEDGDAVAGATVYGRADSSEGAEIWTCTTDTDGGCQISAAAISALDEDGEEVQAAWRFTVDVVALGDGAGHAPTVMVVATDTLEALSAGLAAEGASEATLAFGWEEAEDEHLGSLATSLGLIDLGRGAASAPSALLLSGSLAELVFDFESLTLDLSGAGLATDALGVTTERASTGSGIATDALGVSEERPVTKISGSGLATDALGLIGAEHGADHGLSMGDTPVFPGESSAATSLKDTWTEEALNLAGTPGGRSPIQTLAVEPSLGLVPGDASATTGSPESL